MTTGRSIGSMGGKELFVITVPDVVGQIMVAESSSLRVHRVMSPVRTQVAENLRQAILSRHFKPGQRLVERELVEATGASRTSVREALRELSAEGLVTSIPNKGTVVTEVTRDEARQLYELRSGLEALAGRLFVERATEAEMDALERAFAVIEESYRLGVGTLAAKDAFYDVLFRGARNEQLRQMTAGLHTRVTYLRSFSLTQPGRLTESLSELRDIMNAVKARDADAVGKACLYHIKQAGQAGIDALPDD
jgi:GntR family transcriptional regulator, trigonelline degradation regulator